MSAADLSGTALRVPGSSRTRLTRAAPSGGRPRPCWVWTFAAFTVWSLATPLWSSPDAPAHDLMAYHAVRDLSIEPTDVYANGGTSNAITYAPRGLVESAATVDCYRYLPTPANCMSPPTDDDTLVPFVNPAGPQHADVLPRDRMALAPGVSEVRRLGRAPGRVRDRGPVHRDGRSARR